jgi:hypothetical protein
MVKEGKEIGIEFRTAVFGTNGKSLVCLTGSFGALMLLVSTS